MKFSFTILLNGLASALLYASVLFTLNIGTESDKYFFILSIATFITATFFSPLRSFIIINSQTSEHAETKNLVFITCILFQIIIILLFAQVFYNNKFSQIISAIILITAIIMDHHSTSAVMSQGRLRFVEKIGVYITVPFVGYIFLETPTFSDILLVVALRSYLLGTIKTTVFCLNTHMNLYLARDGVIAFVKLYWTSILSSLAIKNERLLLQVFAIDQMTGLATTIGLFTFVVTGINTFLNRRYGNKLLLSTAKNRGDLMELRKWVIRASVAVLTLYMSNLVIYCVSIEYRFNSEFYLLSIAFLAIMGELFFGFINKLWVNIGNVMQRQIAISVISVFSAIISVLLKISAVYSEYNELFFASAGIAFATCCAGYMQNLKPLANSLKTFSRRPGAEKYEDT